ncbi:TIGR01666 family membrane protein [Aggregatibacter actinomycetemcomitans]|uniref:YccS family putative transporter n=1 Tax=Aggregatibacter actinomycetemcomitans TaxID=714 RepID=UPI00197C16A0|nr:YccS family putative transporter [Aggregatibacter actinomycetemcomitans]MBN6073995.1 TIGR01666 family membrane protein [Aggregatibacter actinomycetemcomitans]
MNRWFNAKVIASIPIFIAVNLAVLAIWYFNISEQSMPLVLGIIAGGLVDLDNRLTGRIKNVFYTLLTFSVSTLSVQLSIGHNLQFMLLMTLMTFAFTMIGALGQRYSTIAFGTLVVALYTTLAYLPDTLWYINPLMILCGTLLYSVTTLCVHLFFPNRPVQESVARSFLALANYLDAKSMFFDPDEIDQIENKHIAMAMKNSELTNAFNGSRTALFYRIRGQHRHSRTTKMIRYYFAAQDIHERISSSHFNYQKLAEHLKNTDLIFRIQRLLELQAQACRNIALSLQRNKTYHYDTRVEKAINGLNQSFEFYSAAHGEESETLLNLQTLLDNLKSVDYQLRHIDQEAGNTEQTERAQIYTEQITGLKNILLAIRSHCSFASQLFRHAVRLSIVVFVCCVISEFLPLDRGYWVLLTAVFVCQPNYTATKLRLKQRIIGTILGVVIGSLLPYTNPTLELQLGLIVLTSTLFFFFRTNNYSFSTFFITLQVIFSFDVMGFDVEQALYSRVIDTLIGATISWFAVSYLWPDWKYLQLDKVSRKAVKSDAQYLLYVVSQLQFGKGDNLKYRIVRRYAHEYATALSATISNMNHEPKKYQAHLQTGFELLKINYSLLSYISALGAYRSKMKKIQQSAVFLAEFYPAAKKIIYILEHLEKLPPDIFEKLHENIELRLKQMQANLSTNAQPEQVQFNIPIQQLSMISQILPSLYGAFQKTV